MKLATTRWIGSWLSTPRSTPYRIGLALIALLIVLVPTGVSRRGLGGTSAPAGPPTLRAASAGSAVGSTGAAIATTSNEATAVGGTSLPATGAGDLPPLGQLVIQNARLALQVNDVETALRQARAIADAGGGYVSASDSSYVPIGGADQLVADLTIQVRADAFDQSVQALRQLAGKVVSESGTSQDVTAESVDLDANLRNLQASEAATLKLMDKAQSLSDILTLQHELTTIRGQIQQIQGRQRYLSQRTALATITVSFQPLPAASTTTTTTPAWNPASAFERGWRASLQTLQTLLDAAITAVAFGWWLTPLAGLGYYLLRRNHQRPGIAPPPAT